MKTLIRTLASSFAVAAILSSAFVSTSAQAKSAHCGAVAVPGQPGHFIVVCSRTRP
jgi:hypothetical protein